MKTIKEHKIKIALVQMRASDDKSKNLERAQGFVEAAVEKGARCVLLPEAFSFRGKGPYGRVAENMNGETVRRFSGTARRLGISVLLGSVYERVPGRRKVYNTSVFLGPDGKVLGKYRKRHLFQACLAGTEVHEGLYFLSGRRNCVISTGPFLAGCAICYDLRFPESFCFYKKRDCDMIMAPSNFTYETGAAHWEVLLRARAVENRCYVLAPNQCGTDSAGMRSYGNSMVVDPWGKVVARAATAKEDMVFAVIEEEKIRKARQRLP